MALKDPTLLFARDPETDPEQQSANPDMGGVASYPGFKEPGAPLPAAPKGTGAGGDDDEDKPSKPAPNPLLVTKDELQQAADQKRKLSLMGAMGDTLSNSQSFGNFFLGRMNQKQNGASQLAGQLSQQADQPVAQKLALQKQAEQAPQLQFSQDIMDPNSTPSKLTKSVALGAISSLPNSSKYAALTDMIKDPNTTGSDVHNAIDKDPILKEAFSSSIAGQKLATTIGMFQGRMQNQNAIKAQQTANGDPVLKTYVQRADGAQKILNLMDAAEKGDVKSNQALLGQLNAEISRLETGSQSPGLGAAEKTEMNDAAAKYHDLLDTISGNVTGVDLSKKFAQARAMVKDLGGSYMNQIDNRMGYLKAGAQDDQLPIFDAKHKQIQYAYKGLIPQSKPQGSQSAQSDSGQSGDKGYSVIPEANAGAEGPHGATVYQNGHTYMWNPASKRYE
jgi:hypothetical protein